MAHCHRRCGQCDLKEVERAVVVLQSGVDDAAVVVVEQEVLDIVVIVLHCKSLIKQSVTVIGDHLFANIRDVDVKEIEGGFETLGQKAEKTYVGVN